MNERIEKLRSAINGLAVGGCLVLAVVKGQVAFQIWEARGPARASIQGIGMLLLVVAAILILRHIRTGALLGTLAAISYEKWLVLTTGAFPLMTYIGVHIVVLFLNAAAWKSMGSAGKSN